MFEAYVELKRTVDGGETWSDDINACLHTEQYDDKLLYANVCFLVMLNAFV